MLPKSSISWTFFKLALKLINDGILSWKFSIKSSSSKSIKRICGLVQGKVRVWWMNRKRDRFSLNWIVSLSHDWYIMSLTQAGTSKRLWILTLKLWRFWEMIFILVSTFPSFVLTLIIFQNILTFFLNLKIFMFQLLNIFLNLLFLFL